MEVSLSIWLAVLAVIVAMLALDLLAHRRAHIIPAAAAADPATPIDRPAAADPTMEEQTTHA